MHVCECLCLWMRMYYRIYILTPTISTTNSHVVLTPIISAIRVSIQLQQQLHHPTLTLFAGHKKRRATVRCTRLVDVDSVAGFVQQHGHHLNVAALASHP